VALREAVAAGAALREVFVDVEAADAGARDEGSALREALEAASAAGVPVRPLAAGVLARVSDTVSPRGVIAVVDRRPVDVARIAAADGPVVVLAGVADPGNAGTVLRSTEAAGGAGVVFCADSVDPFGPKTVRAAAGSVFRIPVAEVADGAPTLAALMSLRAAGRTLLATVAQGAPPPELLDLTRPMALVMGSEAHGLPAEITPVLEQTVTIPMAGPVESLNVAVAASVILFEAARQSRVRR
jgi:TrmH family RNA methyltransferase